MTLTTSIPLFIHAGDQVTVDGKPFVVVRLISTHVLTTFATRLRGGDEGDK